GVRDAAASSRRAQHHHRGWKLADSAQSHCLDNGIQAEVRIRPFGPITTEAAMRLTFGRFLAGLGLGAMCLSAAHASSDFPTRPMTMVVSFAAGGSTDTIARLLAQNVSEILGKAVVVENKPGAEGQLGAQHIAKATPDGYTFGLV